MKTHERAQAKAYERRWWILGVLCFSLLVIVLDNTILNVAIPTIVRELHATNSQLQWMVDSYVLVFAGLLLTAGALGDRFGRRGALQVGLTLFGIGSLASALATSSDQLIATRAFMGIGGAFIMPATLSIITNVFPAPERGKAIGVWAGTAGIAVALGPLTGGFLLEHFYWGSIFLVNLPIVVIGLVAGVFLIPTSKDPAAPPLDIPGALLSITGLSALLYGIIEAPQNGWTNPTIVTAFAVGATLMLAFVLWERHSTHPMLDIRFFKNPRFSAASSSITLVFFGMFGSTFLLTQYFQFVLGYSPLATGVRLLPWAAAMMVGGPSSARLVRTYGAKAIVTFGLILVAGGLASMTALNEATSYLDIFWRLIVMGTGMALVMAPATDSIMGSLPLGKAGVGSAVNDTTRQVGGALGVAIIGSVLSSTYGSKVTDFLAGSPVPRAGKDTAKNSLGGAFEVSRRFAAAKIPGAAQLADSLKATASSAFIDGLHIGVLVGAGTALLGAIVAFVWLPAHARTQDLEEQAAEYAEETGTDTRAVDAEPSSLAPVER